MPTYENEEELNAAVARISRCSPLVFAGEVRSLREQLARACQGQGFVVMGGDCAEAFAEFNVDHVRDSFRVILQMALDSLPSRDPFQTKRWMESRFHPTVEISSTMKNLLPKREETIHGTWWKPTIRVHKP